METEIIQLDHSDPIGNYDIINDKKGELTKLRQKRLEGTMVRAKARWIDQSEKPSRYFCSLENRNFVSKRMVSLIKNNGTEVNNFDLINKEVGNFYRDLYKSRESELINVEINEKLSEETPKLTDLQANSIEGPMTVEEATFF